MGKQSKLVGFPQFGEFGPRIVFDRRLIADVFETGMFDPGTSSLREVSLTFATKISHAGDSQRQRHRRTASSLPNSLNVRVFESGDLFDWIHRWKQRLCYLAQEEIFFVSVDQVKDLEKVMPEIKPLLMAPCGIRKNASIAPRCPEGSRWCGQPEQ